MAGLFATRNLFKVSFSAVITMQEPHSIVIKVAYFCKENKNCQTRFGFSNLFLNIQFGAFLSSLYKFYLVYYN